MLFGWLRHVENKDAGMPTPVDPRLPAGPSPLRPDDRDDSLGELELPLLPILEKLPAELRAKMTKPAGELAQARIFISTGRILEQLPTGSIKITFGQLREAAPGLFRVGTEFDTLAVAVPLNEVLSRLNPKWFARSPAQKAVEVSDEITSPFSASRKPVAPMAAPRPASLAERLNNRFDPSPMTMPPPAAPAHTVPPASLKMAPPNPIIVPLASLSEHWPDAMRAEITQLNLANAHIALPFDMAQSALKRGQAVFSWRTLRAWVKPAPVLAVSVRDNLELSLPLKIIVPLFMAQCKQPAPKIQTANTVEDIPDLIAIKARIPIAEPVPKPVAVPVATPVDAPTQPVPVPAPSAPADPIPGAPVPPVSCAVDPPAVAPTRPVPAPVSAEPAAPVSRPAVAPVPSAPASTVSPAGVPNGSPAPTPLPAAPPQMVAAPKPAVKTAGQIAPAPLTPFVRRATPADIVKQAMELPATAGAIVALPDGLAVASEGPEGMDADMLAAFVPQIFERAGQGVAELRMGELTSLSFTAGNVPWVIFCGSMVYFAVFGRGGGMLSPDAELSALAAELDRRK